MGQQLGCGALSGDTLDASAYAPGMTEAPKSPLATPAAWNLVSEGYVTEIVPTFTRFAQDALRLAHVKEGERVVDVACGPGTLSFEAAALGARVSAIDFAERMVEKLAARAKRENVMAVDARVGDGQALPYADASFDVGFSMFGLMFFPDRAQGFRELFRVVAPGGRVAVSSWQPMDQIELFVEVFGALAKLMPGLPMGGQKKAPLTEASEVVEEMSAAGFTDVAVHTLVHETSHASMEAFWTSTEKSLAPLVLLRNGMGEDAYAPIGQGIYAHLRERFGDGPQKVAMFANLGVARRP